MTTASEANPLAASPAGPSRRAILALALPIMISNVSTPLLGLVDTGVVGRLPSPAYIGAVAVEGGFCARAARRAPRA